MVNTIEGSLNGQGLKIAIVVARFNEIVTGALLRGAEDALRRHGVPLPTIGDIERESYKAQLLTVPEAERLASGRQFMSAENRAVLREQAAKSLAEEYTDDFVYDFVEPGPGDD